MKIRLAQHQDLPTIYAFFPLARKIIKKDAIQNSLKVCALDISEIIVNKPLPEYTYFLAEEKEKIIGVLALDEKEWTISFLYLYMEYQGNGISAQLVRAAQKYAIHHHVFQLGAPVFMKAIPFFLKEEFELLVRQDTPYQIQGRFFMIKKLKPKVVLAIEPFDNGLDYRTFLEILQSLTTNQCQFIACPLSNGTRGFVEALILQSAYQSCVISSIDFMGKRQKVEYAIRGNNAVIEYTSLYPKSGEPQYPSNTVLPASTYGLGLQILDSLKRGCRRIYLVTAGNQHADGGIGMLEALGTHFYDSQGKLLSANTDSLSQIATMDITELKKTIQGITFIGLANMLEPLGDVIQPWSGYLHALEKLGYQQPNLELGSASGGNLGLALLSVLRGSVRDAADSLMSANRFEDRISRADLLLVSTQQISAHFPEQNSAVKALRLAQKIELPTVLFTVCRNLPAECENFGFDAIFCLQHPESLEDSFLYRQLKEALQQVLKLNIQEKNFISQ